MPCYKGWLPANEAARTHAVNEHGAWRMAGKFARVDSNLPAEARCQAFDISSSISALEPLLISILTLWLSISLKITSFSTRLRQNLCAVPTRSPRTPVHSTVILGVPILPVPTLIGILN